MTVAAARAPAANVANSASGRLRRSDPGAEGIRRRRCGRGFRYLGPDGPVTDPPTLARIKALVIPPAWQDAWICPHPKGHIRAIGTDTAGRRQYLYHDQWRTSGTRPRPDDRIRRGPPARA
jgi:DNA topoisomerase IB